MQVKYVCNDCFPDGSPYKCEYWAEYNKGLSVTTCPVDGIDIADWNLTKRHRKILKKKEQQP